MIKINEIKKYFSLFLLTTAVGLFTMACTEPGDEPDPETYTVSISGGTMTWWEDPVGDPNAQHNEDFSSKDLLLYETDVVIILSATPPPGKEFDKWTVSPNVGRFNDPTNPKTTYTGATSDVTIIANFKDALPTGYTISVYGGEMMVWDNPPDTVTPEFSYLENGNILYENDLVIILSAEPEDGEEFDYWDVSPSIYANRFAYDSDKFDEEAAFLMPAGNVIITAKFKPAFVPVNGEASIRFTWEAAEAANITHISVNETDVAWWYSDVFGDEANVAEDFSDIPLYDGNPSLPSFAAPYDATNVQKGIYFETGEGSFTAVCGAEDQYGLAEIVANYTITIDYATSTTNGADKFFEIAFDVGTFIAGEDELGYVKDEYDNPNTTPRLQKSKAPKFGVKKVATKQFKKAGTTVDVTYYVIRRPKKA
jgi:hypothetical protein